MRRLAVLSLHTSPLAQPGTGDGGGMNVYVRELAAALARSDVTCDVFTRAWSSELPDVVAVEPGLRVHHVPAGPLDEVPKEALPGLVDEFTAGVLERMTAVSGPGGDTGGDTLPFTSVHANYWLSGLSGHVIKHELEVPLVSTFHTLDRVKAEAMPEEVEADMPHRRAEAEATIIGCSDAVLASCSVEAEQIASLYEGDPGASASCRLEWTTRSSARATAPRRGARSASRSTAGSSCSSGASSRSSAPTWRSRRWPG